MTDDLFRRIGIPGASGRVTGIAIAPTRLTVALPGRGGVTTRTWALEPMPRGDDSWPALAAALAELRDLSSPPVRRLAVALLPPLAQMRRVELPALRSARLRLFLSRNAGRYFPMVSEPQLANGVALARSSPAPYLTASASARVIGAILRAAQESGLDVATIVPAHAAWVAAARRSWPRARETGGEVAVHVDRHVELLQVEQGRLIGTRRFSGRHAESAASVIDQPDAAAATYAGAARGPELLPESVYQTRAGVRRRWVIGGSGALAAGIVLAAAGALWQAHRTLDTVTRERATLRATVGDVTTAEQRLATVRAGLRAVQRIERDAPLWSDVIADVSDNLPQDAFLARLHVHGDSVAVDGSATHGAGVFERMSGAKLIDDVRAAGPIRHEAKRGAAAVDRFAFTARVPGAAPLYVQTRVTR